MACIVPAAAALEAHNARLNEGEGGSLVIEVTGRDPYVALDADFLPCEAGPADVLVFEVKSPLSGAAQFYWQTARLGEWSEAQHVDVPLEPAEVPGTGVPAWREYEVPVGRLSGRWRGSVTALRFDPTRDGASGVWELRGLRLERREERRAALSDFDPAALPDGGFYRTVRTGIDKTSAGRYVRNERFRVMFSRGRIGVERLVDGAWVAEVHVSFRALGTDGELLVDSTAYDPDRVYCTFAHKYLRCELSANYEGPEGRHAGRLRVVMLPHEPPGISYESRTGEEGLVEFSLQPAAGGFPDVLAAGRLQRVLDDGLSVRTAWGERMWLPVTGREVSVVTCSKRFRLRNPDGVTVDRPQTLVRGDVEVIFVPPPAGAYERGMYLPQGARAYGRIDRELSTEDGLFTLAGNYGKLTIHDTLVYTRTVSSNLIRVNVPVNTGEVRVPVPDGAKPVSVTRLPDGQAMAFNWRNGMVVLEACPPGELALRFERICDWRVLFTQHRPVSAELDAELISNYLYPQLFFLWDGFLDEGGELRPEALERVKRQYARTRQPIFLGMHYGNHGPPGCYSIFHGVMGDGVLQTDQRGRPHPGYPGGFGTPPWMCLVHGGLWEQLDRRVAEIFRIAKEQPWWDAVFAYSSTSEPWIVDDPDDPDRLYCYNPDHVAWFRRYEEAKWGSVSAFNDAMGTSLSSFAELQPPRQKGETALWNEWRLSRYEAVIDSERFYRGLIARGDGERPNYGHVAILLYYDVRDVGVSLDETFAGWWDDPGLYRPGGSLYTTDPWHEAFIADAFRGLTTDDVAFSECYAPDYGAAYDYLIGASSLFRRTLHFAIPGTSWGSVDVGDAWQVFYELSPFLQADMGVVPAPEVALLYSPLSGNREAVSAAHRELFESHIDRCVLSERMVEKGALSRRPVRLLALPDVSVISEAALSAIEGAVAGGSRVFVSGGFAEHDPYYRVGERFLELRERVLSAAVGEDVLDAALSRGVLPAGFGLPPGVCAYRKERGLVLLGRGPAQVLDVDVHPALSGRPLLYMSDSGQAYKFDPRGGGARVALGDSGAALLLTVDE